MLTLSTLDSRRERFRLDPYIMLHRLYLHTCLRSTQAQFQSASIEHGEQPLLQPLAPHCQDFCLMQEKGTIFRWLGLGS